MQKKMFISEEKDCNEERSGVKRKRIKEIKRRKRERKETRRE